MALGGTGSGTDWPPCCSRTSEAGGQMARTRCLCPLPPLPTTGLGSGSRSTHAPPPLLHPLCCTRRRTLTLTLSYSHTRSAAQVCLSSSACRPLSLLSFFLLPTFLHALDNPYPPHARPPSLSLSPRVRMNLPHSWSVSSSLPYSPRLNFLVPRGASSPRPRVDSSNLSS